jgi:hypothetical protein
MLLTFGALSSGSGTATREHALRYPDPRHPNANVFRRLERRLGETENVKPMAHVNAGRPWTLRTPANKDAIICGTKTVEKLMRYRTINGTIPIERSSKYVMRSLASIPLIAESTSVFGLTPSADAFLRMNTTSRSWDKIFVHNILWKNEVCIAP